MYILRYISKLLSKFLSCCIGATILVIIFRSCKTFSYWLDSPQVKQDLISSIKNFTYELPDEVLNDSRLTSLDLRKLENIGKISNLAET